MSGGPSWFTEEHVLNILSEYETFPKLVKLNSWSLKPATSKGENFASSLNVLESKYILSDGSEKSSSFIVKCRLENEMMDAIESDFNVFERETQVYRVIIKEMEGILRSIEDYTELAPKAIYLDDKMIVLENLKNRGYSIGDVKVGLGKEQISMICEKLAKFHACSMVLYDKFADMFKNHLSANMSENENPLHIFYKNAIDTCIQFCESKPGLQKYSSKLKEFHPKVISKLIDVFSRNEKDRYHVLNHGDCWVNNFMFKDKTENVIFIDFQEGYYGSPGIDLNYLFCSSLTKDTYIQHKNELIIEYQNTLSDILRKLHYSKYIPSVEDVHFEILNKGFHGLATVTATLPILMNMNPEVADPMNFILDTDDAKANRIKVFNNPRYEGILEVFLKEYVEHNILI
ncbi:hypothetical protein ACFFRR_000783 [Megaselia abdita]